MKHPYKMFEKTDKLFLYQIVISSGSKIKARGLQGAAQSGEGGVVILKGKLVTRDPSFVDVGGGYHGDATLHGKNGYYRRKKLIFILVILFFSIKN